jgi:nucleotide-binding universal stress UspA family protein
MKRIIIPTDFSKNAENAVDYAIQLFDQKDIYIILLNTCYLPYTDAGAYVSMDDVIAKNANKLFKKELERINKKKPKLKAIIESRFEVGDLVKVVEYIEKKEKIHAVVMGTKGASGFIEILVGSNTAAMIRSVSCPVFAIPDHAKFQAPKKILFTTDYERFLPSDKVHFIIDLVKQFKSHLKILHISKKQEKESVPHAFLKHELDFDFLSIPHSFDEVIGEQVVSSLENYMKEHPMDLVIMLSEKGNLFHKIFHKSRTRKMILHTQTPLLILNK